MSVSENFIDRIENCTTECLAIIDKAEKRGRLTRDEEYELDRAEFSQLPILLTAFEMATEHEGRRVYRSTMVPSHDRRARKGLHINTAAERPEIFIYGPIGSDGFGGISAADVQREVERFNSREAIDIHVHSQGGSFTEGVAIHSLISNRSGDVFGHVDGLAASAASILLMACSQITMARASRQMIHFASINSEGSMDEDDLRFRLKLVRETNEAVLGMYLPRWRGTEAELNAALRSETYYTAPQAIAAGLADHISETARVAPYACRTEHVGNGEFSIAASASPGKRFNGRRATLKLWQLAADEMKRDLRNHS